MGINLSNADKLNEEMTFYRDYYQKFEAIMDGMAEITGLNDLPESISVSTNDYSSNSFEETEIPALTDVSGTIYKTFTGTGDTITDSIEVSEPTAVLFECPTYDNAVLKAYYGNDEYDYELLVNEIAPYSGYTYLLPGRTYEFDIKHSGGWTLALYTIGNSSSSSFAGNGDTVTPWFLPTSNKYKITNSGDGNFVVYTRHGNEKYDYDLLINEIGEYSGIIRIDESDKYQFFIVQSDGDWTIEPVK